MQFDIDAARMTLAPWDFLLKVGGVAYRVRELTLQEFNDLAARGRSQTPEEDVATLQALFVGDPQPDVRAWDADRRDEAYAAIGAYLNAYLEKKRERIRRQVRDGLAAAVRTTEAPSTSGAS